MQLHIPFGAYKKQLRLHSNEPVTLTTLLSPFGLPVSGEEDSSLCVGLVLDQLAENFYDFECIDPLDVATAAWELDYKPARDFLTTGPGLLTKFFSDEYC